MWMLGSPVTPKIRVRAKPSQRLGSFSCSGKRGYYPNEAEVMERLDELEMR